MYLSVFSVEKMVKFKEEECIPFPYMSFSAPLLCSELSS